MQVLITYCFTIRFSYISQVEQVYHIMRMNGERQILRPFCISSMDPYIGF